MSRSVLVALSLIITAPAGAHEYEMKDLEALEKQEAWQEAVQHLGDILPSKRNDTWQRIAERATAGQLGQLEGRAVLQAADDFQKRFPILKKSKVFQQGRADAGLKAFSKTYADSRHSSSDDPWLDELKAFVEADPLTPDLALRAGKLVTSRLVAYLGVPFFKRAVASSAGACKDADVRAALVAALAENVWSDDAKALVDKSCWSDVRAELEAELKKDNNRLKKSACPLFAARKLAIAACKQD